MKKQDIKFIYGVLKPYFKKEIFGLFIVICSTFLSLLNPYITKQIIDVSLANKDIKSLYINVIYLIGVFVFTQILSIIRSYTFTYILEKLSYDMRMALYRSISQKPVTFFSDKQIGELMVRILNEIEQVTSLFAGTIINILIQIATFVIALFFMVSMNIFITIISLCLIPVLCLILRHFNPKLKDNNQRLMEHYSRLSDILQNNLHNMKIIKYMNAYKYGEKRFSFAMHYNIKLKYRALFLNTMISILISTMYSIPSTAVFLIGGYFVIYGNLTVGSIYALLAYVNKLFDPVMALASVNLELQHSIIAYKRYVELLGLDKGEMQQGMELKRLEKGIELENIEFCYENRTPILSGFNIFIPLGSIIQLKGSNGTGKSTVINLITGLIKANRGEIKYDNIEIHKIKSTSFKKLIGIIPQNTYLFNDTIRNNINMGRGIDDNKIIELSQELECTDVISGNEINLDTVISNSGNNISGGQAQKISIMRALIHNPQIIILDEAYTFLDINSKELLDRYIQKICTNKIVIIVSHDNVNSMKPDIIIDLESCKVSHTKEIYYA